jgi:hypothetical protein
VGGAAGTRVAADFLGLSFEADVLPDLPRLVQAGTLGRMLGSIGTGTLRFGGRTADREVAWAQPGAPRPRWASNRVSPADLQALASLSRETGWKVLLTVNLAHYNPSGAAGEAAAAAHLLGTSLYGVAVGNEPDRLYRDGFRGPSWSFSHFARQLEAYRSAIRRSAPSVRTVAPEASSGEVPLAWVRAAIGLHPAMLTDHYYPLTSCGTSPTVGELLSPPVRGKESSMLASLRRIQSTAGIPLQLDETNNISCKGQPGVSNSFASALWATDYIGRAMATGLRGLDFHSLLGRSGSYSPLVFAGGGLHANPEWYALLLTRALEGTSVLPAQVSSEGDLTAHAFRGPGGTIEVLLVNFDPVGSTPLRVNLDTPLGAAPGTILRLGAPSPHDTSNVRLGGAEVARSGAWQMTQPLPDVYRAAGQSVVALPASSAALVTLSPGGA